MSLEVPRDGHNSIKYEDLPLNSGLDQQWCEMFTEVYGFGRYRAMVEVPFILAQDRGTHWRRRPAGNHYTYFSMLSGIEHPKPALLEGDIIGATVPTEWIDSYTGEYAEAPYLILSNVVRYDPSAPVSRDEFDHIYVPLERAGENLLIFAPVPDLSHN